MIGQQVVERTVGLNLAAVVNHNVIANILDIRQKVAAEDYRFSAFGERHDQVFNLAATDRVQAGGGLVKNHQVGIVDQRLRQPNAPLHALGEFANHPGPNLTQTNHLQQLLVAALALGWREVKEVAKKIKCLVAVKKSVQVGLLGQVSDAGLGGDMPG